MTDIQERVGDHYAIEMTKIFEECQESIGKHKFDIGCIPDIECKITLLEGVKPGAVQNKPKPRDHEDEIQKTVKVSLQHGIISPDEA